MHPRENPGYAYEFAYHWKKNLAGPHASARRYAPEALVVRLSAHASVCP